MKILYNKTILIGREPGNNRLMLAIKAADGIKTATIGGADSVPNSVSRCVPVNNMAHCKLDIDASGNIRLTNMKEENVTYVGNNEVMSKNVNENSTISLGRDKFPIGIGEILQASKAMFEKVVTPPEPPQPGGYSIAHLEKVWNEYEDGQEQLQKETRKVNLARSLIMPLSMLATAIGVIGGIFGVPGLSVVIIPISLFIACWSFYKGYINDKRSPIIKKQLQEKLIENYICPNPGCKHFMGFQPYKILKQNKNCPYCKGKYKTE